MSANDPSPFSKFLLPRGEMYISRWCGKPRFLKRHCLSFLYFNGTQHANMVQLRPFNINAPILHLLEGLKYRGSFLKAKHCQ